MTLNMEEALSSICSDICRRKFPRDKIKDAVKKYPNILNTPIVDRNVVIVDTTILVHTAECLGNCIDLEESIKFLLECGADINSKCSGGVNVLYEYLGIIHTPNLSFIEFLIKEGVDVGNKNIFGNTILMLPNLPNKINMPILKCLVENGAGVNDRTPDSKDTILISFIKNCDRDPEYKEYILYLIEKGADVRATNKKGRSIFFYCKKLSCHDLAYDIYEAMLKQQKDYYEKLIEQKLREQNEQLLDELYKPEGLGYTMARERFEKHF